MLALEIIYQEILKTGDDVSREEFINMTSTHSAYHAMQVLLVRSVVSNGLKALKETVEAARVLEEKPKYLN